MEYPIEKFKKVVVLDTVIFYPEHRQILNTFAEEVFEYPTSLPEGLERQYVEHPELFINKKCYTQIATDNTPLQLLMNRVEGADVIISCWTDIPDEILRLNPQLKLIVFWTHEKEHRINIKLADELGIRVTNIPDYGTDAVAEVVFAGLLELLQRNFGVENAIENGPRTAFAIANCVFRRFRQLQDNEKYTRAGKFTHHFHKIGQVKFDFTKKHIDDLIPERLVEQKHVGLLNIKNATESVKMLRAFGVVAEHIELRDSSQATFYKFLAENDLIFFDSKTVDLLETKKIAAMFGEKLIDVSKLQSTEYSFDGKVFGVIGLGRIGSKVAAIAKQLGFKVTYYSKTRRIDLEERLGISYMDLEALVTQSDIVSLHLPAHKAENLLDAELIAKLKKGSLFINTADGNAIDQQALTKRMAAREVFAYLDVYPGLPRKDVLGMPMLDATDWKIHKELPEHVFAYRAGWKTQESIRIKTYKLLGEMATFLVGGTIPSHLPATT